MKTIFEKDLSGEIVSPNEPGYEALITDIFATIRTATRRLEAARELIRKGGRKVSDICFEVGFKNLSHFSKIYKETYGIPPTEDTQPGISLA